MEANNKKENLIYFMIAVFGELVFLSTAISLFELIRMIFKF